MTPLGTINGKAPPAPTGAARVRERAPSPFGLARPKRAVSQETDHLGATFETSGEDWTLELNPREREFLNRCLTGLTAREREVVFAICSGGTNEELADRLCIALPTVRTHLMRLNQKLGTTSKGDVVRLVASRLLDGYRHQVIRPPSV